MNSAKRRSVGIFVWKHFLRVVLLLTIAYIHAERHAMIYIPLVRSKLQRAALWTGPM